MLSSQHLKRNDDIIEIKSQNIKYLVVMSFSQALSSMDKCIYALICLANQNQVKYYCLYIHMYTQTQNHHFYSIYNLKNRYKVTQLGGIFLT